MKMIKVMRRDEKEREAAKWKSLLLAPFSMTAMHIVMLHPSQTKEWQCITGRAP